MSYTPTAWTPGDKITSAKLNKLEAAVTVASATALPVVTADNNGQVLSVVDGEWAPASGGVIPAGTLQISSNGTYNVADYAEASVNVSAPNAAWHGAITIVNNTGMSFNMLYNTESPQSEAFEIARVSNGASKTAKAQWYYNSGSYETALEFMCVFDEMRSNYEYTFTPSKTGYQIFTAKSFYGTSLSGKIFLYVYRNELSSGSAGETESTLTITITATASA